MESYERRVQTLPDTRIHRPGTRDHFSSARNTLPGTRDHLPGTRDHLPGVDHKFRSICDKYEGLLKENRQGPYPPTEDYGKHVKFQGNIIEFLTRQIN